MGLCERVPGMKPLRNGRYVVRLADGADDLRRAQRLRWQCFRGRSAAPVPHGGGLDADDLDARCSHVLIEEVGSGMLVCCFRFLSLASGQGIGSGYAARYYDLSRLAAFPGHMVEIGRFCIHPDWPDPDILRLAWGAMTAHVDAQGVEIMFGCSSFIGADPKLHLEAFSVLRDHHLAPSQWRPGVRAPKVFRFEQLPLSRRPEPLRTRAAIPPLLRTYLLMGGWVSDHAVVDRELDTMHVFTSLEVGALPETRKRLLRAMTG